MDRAKLYEKYLREGQKLDCKEFVDMQQDWCDNFYIIYLNSDGDKKRTSFYHAAFVDWLFDSYLEECITMEVGDE